MKTFQQLNIINKFVFIIFVTLIFSFNFLGNEAGREYILLGKSFLEGRLNLPDNYQILDTVFYKGHVYYPLGPFPALLSVPFIIIFNNFGLEFHLGYLNSFLTLGILYLCLKIARFYNYSINDSFILSLAFCFASVYQVIALHPLNQYLTQSITTFLILLAIYKFLIGKLSPWLLGILYALVLVTRFIGLLTLSFFIISVLEKKVHLNIKVKYFLKVIVPIFLFGCLLAFYNYLRFGNIFETGYKLAITTEVQKSEILKYGYFNIKYLPTNFYYYFIKTVDPVIIERSSELAQSYLLKALYIKTGFPGVSFFVTSPIFLYVFRTKFSNKVVKLTLFPLASIILFYLCFYWSGWVQIGPRYLVDILPYAFLLLLNSFKNYKLTSFQRSLIYISSLFNLYLFMVNVVIT